MRIQELLYFAPGLRLDQVDLDDDRLPGYLHQRLTGYYIEPAQICVAAGYAFAAGALLVSCIDALARYQYGGKVGIRFKRFCSTFLPSFSAPELAARFYADFRNGLVHEARLKRGGQFSLEAGVVAQEIHGLLIVNPSGLAEEVADSLGAYQVLLEADPAATKRLRAVLKEDHKEDFAFARP